VPGRDPLRVVLGHAPPHARVLPALELSGPLDEVLADLGRRGVLSLLVEGGATVAHEFHHAGLVDRYVVYLAPALMGGSDGAPLFACPGVATIADLRRSHLLAVRQLGGDLRVDLAGSPVPAVVA
jgi:diaminohydroxyphosphoribosylaminopyrimidine deaminase/5-amino-6-(5-phosphoribosylamino)uracil reductase